MVSNIDNAQVCGHVQSSIKYDGVGEVSILLFFFWWRNFTHKKKHKMQTSNLYSDILFT